MSSLLARLSRSSRAAALTLAPSGVSLACSFPLGDGDSLSVCAVVNFFFPKFFLFTFPFSIGRLGRSSENGHSPSHTGKLSSSPILATAVKTHRAADRSWSPLAAAGRLRNVHSSSVHFLRRGANFAIASMPAILIPYGFAPSKLRLSSHGLCRKAYSQPALTEYFVLPSSAIFHGCMT